MLFKDHKIAYFAEDGNFVLNLAEPASTTYFLVCALVVEQNKALSLAKVVQEIRENELGGGELITAFLDKDHGVRFRILKRLLDSPFDLVYLVLDKRRTHADLYDDSKQDFKEHFSQSLYCNLKKIYNSLKIVVNEEKSEFRASFEAKMAQEGLLFNSYEFAVGNGSHINLLQLADFLCRTLALGYGKIVPGNYKAYLNFLRQKIIWGQVFPREYADYLKDDLIVASENCQQRIAEWSIQQALDYVTEYENSNVFQELDRVAVLERLLFQLQLKPREYLGTDRLKELLLRTFGREYTDQQFRADIIAPLRDAGVLISSSAKGYKLPLNLEEIYAYSKHTTQMVYPMLERLKKCRNSILMATEGELDIVDGPEYDGLRAYFNFALNNEKKSEEADQ